MVRLLTGKGPRPLKEKKRRGNANKKPSGTLIRQRKDGVLYFSAKDEYGTFSHWIIEPVGEKWLASRGSRPGDRVGGSVIRDLISMGYARTKTIDTPSATSSTPKRRKPRNDVEAMKRLWKSTEEFERKRAEENKRYPALARKARF